MKKLKRRHVLVVLLSVIIMAFLSIQFLTYKDTFILMTYSDDDKISKEILAVDDNDNLILVEKEDINNNEIKKSQVEFYRKGLFIFKSKKIFSLYKKEYYLSSKNNKLILVNSKDKSNYDIDLEIVKDFNDSNIEKNMELVYLSPILNKTEKDDLVLNFENSTSTETPTTKETSDVTKTEIKTETEEIETEDVEEEAKSGNLINVKYSEVTLSGNISSNEEEAGLKPLVISPIPNGGSRIAWMGTDGKTHVTTLNSSDEITGSTFTISGNDFSDMFAHNDGGVILHTKSKESGEESLLNYPPDTPIPCYGMYLTKFDNSGNIIWSTEITNNKVPYTEGAIFVWWYAHHGRIAWNGSSYAAYYGAAMSVSGDIHQGDRQSLVSSSGTIQSGGWDWGCSHSGYEYVIWDGFKNKFASICKTDNNDRIMYNVNQTVRNIDLWYSNLSTLVSDKKGGYWTVVSDKESSQIANTDGFADVHLLHFTPEGTTDKDIVIAGQNGLNERSPHISLYGDNHILVGWETSSLKGDLNSNDSNRNFYVKAFDISTGKAASDSLKLDIKGNRYRDLVSFPDGSTAFISTGSSSNEVKIARIYSDIKDESTMTAEVTNTPTPSKENSSQSDLKASDVNIEDSLDITDEEKIEDICVDTNLEFSNYDYKWIKAKYDDVFKD
jgi:hypothetical protein